MTKVLFYNVDDDGCCKSILAGCYKFGAATLLRRGATMTSVIEYVETQDTASH